MNRSFSSPQEGFDYLESFTNLERTGDFTLRNYRLDRMKTLTERFGRPQDSCQILHLAGSKGKGSTAAFLARALTDRGYRTGLYTSPHITGYKERITLAGREIKDPVFLEEMEKIRAAVESLGPNGLPGDGNPTTFELLTLLAFLVFRRVGCHWAILETGMGGRLDATNLVTPQGVFITTIELEHTEYLGDTLGKIACEKAGIIKAGVPVFCGNLEPEAREVIRRRAEEMGCPLHLLAEKAPEQSYTTTTEGEKVELRWKDGRRSLWFLKMRGRHQGENSALAALGLMTLFNSQGGFSQEELCASFSVTALPARMEEFFLDESPWIFDGAHTPGSMKLTVEAFRKIHGSRGILLFGTTKGKPVKSLIQPTIFHFSHIIVSRAGDFKPEKSERVYQAVKEVLSETSGPSDGKLPTAELICEPEEAFRRTRELSRGGRPVLVTGSFYLAAAIRRCFVKSPAQTAASVFN